MTKKMITKKYSQEIESLAMMVRKWITSNDERPDDEQLLTKVEDEFFNCLSLRKVDINEIRIIIDAVYQRVRYKYGIIDELLSNADINEVMVNGPENIFVERNGSIVDVDNAFTSTNELEEFIRMLANDVHREINEANPIVDARLSNGYRVNGVLKNVAINGPILTIRKFSDKEIGLDDLIKNGSISKECAEDLAALVNSGYNIFVSGGTSSGKTTFLNALAAAIDPHDRAIIIEDSSELKINQLRNKVHMECRNANSVGKGAVSMEQLIRTSLRMRPDRIIVGEVRGKEVVDMIQAMSTGHDGSMSTGHGNSIKGMLNRLETMYLMDSQIPIISVKNQIANAIDIFVHLRRDAFGRRMVVEVAELLGFDGENYKLNYLYITDSEEKLVRTSNSLIDRERLIRSGFDNVLEK